MRSGRKVQVPEDGTLLPLMEAFYTIQGEGYNTGKDAYFIRLGGCDVGCHWCDVKESWNAELHPLTAADSIVEQAAAHPARTVVVTGGEPLIYNLDIGRASCRERVWSAVVAVPGTRARRGAADRLAPPARHA